MTRRIMFSLAAALAVGACSDAPTTSSDTGSGPSFITSGQLDGSAHPAVVLIIADVSGAPLFRCSGTLIAPTVVLTAGHCTHNGAGKPPITAMRIFTESDVQNGDNHYPFAGPNTIEAADWESHPQFPNFPFFLNDVGLILLSSPFPLATSQYGHLPRVNQLDALRPGGSSQFTAVGYGLQNANKNHLQGVRIRMRAEPRLIQINSTLTGGFSLLLSANSSTGGTCFGDSGGPNYLGSSNVIAGVTSYARNKNCAGTGGAFRLDRQNVLNFITGQLASWSVTLPS